METIIITRDEFEELKRLQVRQRWDWPATFTANQQRDIWPFKRWGNTPVEERIMVRGLSKIIDTIADEYLRIRCQGGRFFINDIGAYYAPEFLGMKVLATQFVTFRISG